MRVVCINLGKCCCQRVRRMILEPYGALELWWKLEIIAWMVMMLDPSLKSMQVKTRIAKFIKLGHKSSADNFKWAFIHSTAKFSAIKINGRSDLTCLSLRKLMLCIARLIHSHAVVVEQVSHRANLASSSQHVKRHPAGSSGRREIYCDNW